MTHALDTQSLRSFARARLYLCLMNTAKNRITAACAFVFIVFAVLGATPAQAGGDGMAPPNQHWPWEGVGADWDKNQLLRGYTVATQVCMSCHSFKYISHRDLMKVGFTEAEVKALAQEIGLSVNDKLMSQLTDADAMDVYGKEVPELSVMVRARAHGADYLYALLTGYKDDIPPDFAPLFPEGLPEGAYFNTHFPGHAIAMPSPLSGEGLVDYHDGTEATIANMARDVTVFMKWTSEPELMKRQHLGIYVLLYVLIFIVLTYLFKRAVWRDVKGVKNLKK